MLSKLNRALERLLTIFMDGLENGTVQIAESVRRELLDWYVSQPVFIQRLCAKLLDEAGILSEDTICSCLSRCA